MGSGSDAGTGAERDNLLAKGASAKHAILKLAMPNGFLPP